MEREDVLIVIFLVMLIFGLFYIYENLNSFECFMENTFNSGNDVRYEFEPEGSVYGKTRIFRFNVMSSTNRLEYFGVKISKGNEVLFFENRTEPEGGTILATIDLNETNITVNRFFKKRCYPEVDYEASSA